MVDGSFFLSSGIPRGGRGGIFKIRTLGHGSNNMDSDTGKESFVVAPSSAGSSSKADAWREFEWKLMCVLIFQTEQSSIYILSLGCYLQSGGGILLLNPMPTWICEWLVSACVIRGFNSFNSFFPQSERVITLIPRFAKRKTCGRGIIISITSLIPI